MLPPPSLLSANGLMTPQTFPPELSYLPGSGPVTTEPGLGTWCGFVPKALRTVGELELALLLNGLWDSQPNLHRQKLLAAYDIMGVGQG